MINTLKRIASVASVSDIITLFATLVLGSVLLVVVLAMIAGLFVSSVDNTEVFNLISPAFQTIVGAFVGLISGIHLGKKEIAPTPELPPEPNPAEEIKKV
jgi:hypothetical protein